MDTHAIASEDDFLALIAGSFPNTHESLILGRGDDCAEIACPPRMAVSTDLFVEDVHFRSAYFTPFEAGYKALAVNISDIAAAGGVPLGVSVGLVVPAPFPRETALGIIDGMAHAARQYGFALTGGDLSRGDKLSFCVTIWGGPAKTADGLDTPFLRRGPVSPGDILFVCGRPGLARAGLSALETHGRAAMGSFPEACAAHLTPIPLVEAGQALAAIPGCRLMDVSDGLARDLPRMLEAYGSRCGAAITLPESALHPEVAAYARDAGQNPVRFAFSGGEDYALLGACPISAISIIQKAIENLAGPVPFLPLGTATAGQGIILNGTPLKDRGFDHFTTRSSP